MSLAVTDLLIGMVVAPLNAEYHHQDGQWIHNEVICIIWASTDIVAATASVWTMAIIAVDRMIAVVYPIKYMSMSYLPTLMSVVGVWVVSVGICIPSFFDVNLEYCKINQKQWTAIFSALFAFFIPVAILTISYFTIFIQLRSNVKRRLAHQHCYQMKAIKKDPRRALQKEDLIGSESRKTSSTTLTQILMPSSHPVNNTLDQCSPTIFQSQSRLKILKRTPNEKPDVKISRQKEKRVLIQMTVLIVAFLICCLPFWIHYVVLSILCYSEHCYYPSWIDDGLQWLSYCNSLVNPILYTIFNIEYRIAFRDMIKGKLF